MRPLFARTIGTRLLRLRRVMRYSAQLPGLLGECGLCEKLLTLQILNAVLHLGNLGFVDFEGACAVTADDAALPGVCGFLPPVSHMMATMRKASPMRSQDWAFFGRRPCGFGVFSCT